MPQRICTHCKRIISVDGFWKEYYERSAESASLEMKGTICPDCSIEKYPQFYGIHHSKSRGYSNALKLVAKPLSSIKRMVL